MNWEGGLIAVGGSGGCSVANGIRFSLTRGHRETVHLIRIRLGRDVLNLMGWQGGDKIGVRWSRQDRKMLLYRRGGRIQEMPGERFYAIKLHNSDGSSSGGIEINPCTFGETNADIRAIVESLAKQQATTPHIKGSDGLIVSLVEDSE